MVNTDDFIKRLELLMDYFGLNASLFADKIGVQRSSISHLLSGRNKPSLDFILKIIEAFPEVDLYWILIGKDNMIKSKNLDNAPKPITEVQPLIIEDNLKLSSKSETPQNQQAKIDFETPTPIATKKQKNGIFKIVIFYDDGSFNDFQPPQING
jgi:plasmid maintenance system antidote protein VapI